jgi:hypothetical protein
MILVAIIIIITMLCVNAQLPPQISFSAKATARILRGDINLKGYDFYLVYADVTKDAVRLRLFSEAKSRDGMLRIHAKDIDSEGIYSLLMIDAGTKDEDFVRIVNPRVDPPDVFETSNDFSKLDEDVEMYLQGKLKRLDRNVEDIRKYGDALRTAPSEDGIEAATFREKILSPTGIDSVLFVQDPSCDVCNRVRSDDILRLCVYAHPSIYIADSRT